nr:putative alpha/beta-Hydrolases superfamily protein [Ipomoea batatas]
MTEKTPLTLWLRIFSGSVVVGVKFAEMGILEWGESSEMKKIGLQRVRSTNGERNFDPEKCIMSEAQLKGSLLSRQYVNPPLDSKLDFFVDVGNNLAYATGEVIRFNRSSWSRSVECSSRVLVNLLIVVFNRISRSRFVKVLSRVLISHLFTAFNPCSRRRSTEISSRVLVNPIVSVFDRNSGSSESSSAELVGLSPVAIPGADPWKARAMCSLIINDSWSRSMDSWSRVTVAVSSPQRRTRMEKQQAPSQPKTAGDDGGALSKLSPTLKSSVSDSSDSLLLMSGTEDRVVAPLLVFFMLVTKPPKFGGSFKKIEGSRKFEHSNLKKVDNASEVDCIRTLEGMHYVDFYNCWNEYQQESSTQIFILSDKPKDANLILVGFRGTESLDVDDWSFADQDIDGRALMLFLLKHKGSNQINFEIGWPCYC